MDIIYREDEPLPTPKRNWRRFWFRAMLAALGIFNVTTVATIIALDEPWPGYIAGPLNFALLLLLMVRDDLKDIRKR